MKLTFDPDFDSGAWPGPLAGRAAVGGEEWVGPEGLLGRLELALGLGGPARSAAERAASIVPRVLGTEGFWSESAQVDPLGSARRLLVWRDELAMGGWKGGEIAAPRLRQLADVTREAPPGRPDRLAAVAAALERRDVGIRSLELLCPIADLAPAWRLVFARLAARGVTVVEGLVEAATQAPEAADLRGAATPDFSPVGDGSLQLLRPYGPIAAADIVAAHLAGAPAHTGVVIVSPDVVLDAALRRHGLPSLGASDSARESLPLQILPLSLALAWNPPDPQRALELLTLPAGPVPRGVARSLADKLHEWPAVGSDVWNAALERGLTAIAEEPGDGSQRRAQRVRERLSVLFTSSIPYGSRYPASEVRRRLDGLEPWMRGRALKEHDPDGLARWAAPIDQVGTMRRLLDACGLPDFTAAQIQWLVESATEATAAPARYPAQAGFAAVQEPGAVAGPAATVVWWNFTLETAPPVHRLPLSALERSALAAADVELLDPGAEALRRAKRWRRPLQQARERLLLVTPRRAANGDEAFPHPLWDEIVAPVRDGTLRARLGGETPRLRERESPPARREGLLRASPAPRRSWRVAPGAIPQRVSQSPSSLEKLLGCSLRWTLEEAARLRSGETGALPAKEQLAGKLAHEILSRVLLGRPPAPEEARRKAQALFDEEGPRLAAPLFLPGADDPRGEARHAIGLSAQALAQVLGDGGLVVVAAEENLEAVSGTWRGKLHGRPDLIVGPPPAIIDLKWGAWRRRQSLENGTALQLAAYAVLLRDRPRAPWPDVAYFILRTQQLLTASARFPNAEIVKGRSMEQTWKSFEAKYEEIRRALDLGELLAPGNPDEAGEIYPEEDDLDLEGRLQLAPPCHFCELGALCGRAFGGDGGSA